MAFDPERHRRRSIRLQEYDYSQAGAYLVTLCTKDRRNLFWEIGNGSMQLNPFGEIVQACWQDLPLRYPDMELDAFVVMPNHLHAIVLLPVGAIHELPLQGHRIQRRRMLLPKIVGYAKMNTAKRINQLRDTPSTPVWQRNYYEHVIRDEASLSNIRLYIAENPMRWADDEENPINISKRTGH